MFLKNRNIIFKMKISKVTDYAALKILILNHLSLLVYNKNMCAYYMYIVVGMLQLGIHT